MNVDSIFEQHEGLLWSVKIPYDRSDVDVHRVRVDTDVAEFEFTGRRKDLEFEADSNEFMFDTRNVEHYE